MDSQHRELFFEFSDLQCPEKTVLPRGGLDMMKQPKHEIEAMIYRVIISNSFV